MKINNILAFDLASKTAWAYFKNNNLHDFNTYNFSSISNNNKKIHAIYKYCVEVIKLIKAENIDLVVLEDTYLKQYKKNDIENFKFLSMLQSCIVNYLIENDIKYYIVHTSCWKSYFKLHINSNNRKEQKQLTLNYINKNFTMNVFDDDIADSVGMCFWSINNLHIFKNEPKLNVM